MPKREKVYERELKTPTGNDVKAVVTQLIEANKGDAPIVYTYEWEEREPVLYIRSKYASWTMVFAPDRVVVFATLTGVGRVFNTKKNRRRMVELLDSIVDELESA